MIKILLDINIIIDFYCKRENFEYAKNIFEMVNNGEISACVASHTLSNIFYILRKNFSVNERKKIIGDIRQNFDIVELNDEIIDSALKLSIKDFEDAIQVVSANVRMVDYIVTCNIKDYVNNVYKIKVINSKDFLQVVDGSNFDRKRTKQKQLKLQGALNKYATKETAEMSFDGIRKVAIKKHIDKKYKKHSK